MSLLKAIVTCHRLRKTRLHVGYGSRNAFWVPEDDPCWMAYERARETIGAYPMLERLLKPWI